MRFLRASDVAYLKVKDDKGTLNPSNLLGLTQEALQNALCTLTIQAGKIGMLGAYQKPKQKTGC